MKHSDASDLSSKIREWLKKQGYSLEMRVAQAFNRAGFRVSISHHYLDPKSDEIREIDVVASVSREVGNIEVTVDIYIECKYTSKPWVVFTSQKETHPFAYFSRVLRGRYDVFRWESRPTLQARLLSKILSSLGRDNIQNYPPFLLPQSIGYRVTESLRPSSGGRDPAYSALLQVNNSVWAHDIKAEHTHERILSDELETRGGNSEDLYIFASISIPLIFIRGKLFECFLNPEGEIELKEVNSSVVMMSSKDIIDGIHPGNSVDSIVRIVVEDILDDFATQMFSSANALLQQETAIARVWQHEQSKLPKLPSEYDIPF